MAINCYGFLEAKDLDLEYNRWEDFWGANFYGGKYRLQLGYMKTQDSGKVYVFDPFLLPGNRETPWKQNINLLERIDQFYYRFWGWYYDIDTAIDALLSLVIMKESDDVGEA
jgi:hypothetical protein